MQLQQAMGNLWVEAFVRDWLADYKDPFTSWRLEGNRKMRQILLRESFNKPNEEQVGPRFRSYANLFLKLQETDHNGASIPLSAVYSTEEKP